MSSTAGIGTYLNELVPRVAALMVDAKFSILGASEALSSWLGLEIERSDAERR